MIKGKRIILRTIREKDLDEYISLQQMINERGEFFPLTLRSETELRKKYSETGFWTEELYLMLVTDLDSRILGYIAAFKSHNYFLGLEVGYQIFKREDRGKGYMSEALELFCAYLFDWRPLERLYLTIVPGNIASRRIAEKAGFKLDGTLRKAAYNWGEYCDLEIFSLLRAECPGLKAVWEKQT